jgi:hypothetical protein
MHPWEIFDNFKKKIPYLRPSKSMPAAEIARGANESAVWEA